MSKIPLPIPSLPVRFQPLGRASVFPAEATWSDKAAELSADYLSYGPFGRSAMENGTLEPVTRILHTWFEYYTRGRDFHFILTYL